MPHTLHLYSQNAFGEYNMRQHLETSSEIAGKLNIYELIWFYMVHYCITGLLRHCGKLCALSARPSGIRKIVKF